MKTITETLAEREQQHGNFISHCNIERALRSILDANCEQLDDVMYVGAGMVIHKLARILNGGAEHADSWHDIGGYAALVEKHVMEINEFRNATQATLDDIANER